MRYLVLVSHGTFAPGLHNAVGMMAGANREDIRSTSLLDGMDVDTYRKAFAELVADITVEDEILLFADIIGGSPLTTPMEGLTEKGLAEHTAAIGGVDPPPGGTPAFSGGGAPLPQGAAGGSEGGRGQLKPFDLDSGDEDEI